MIRQSRVIHPFLIALFPILLLYSRNFHTVAFSETFAPLAVNLTITLIAWVGLRAFKIDGPRAALVVSTALVLAFSFSHGVRLLGRVGLGSSRACREWMTLGIEALTLAGVVGLAWKKPGFVRGSTGFLNGSAVALVALSSLGIARQGWAESKAVAPKLAETSLPTFAPPAGRQPDVYFLVLDAYGRSDSLKEIIGFDNEAFLAKLEHQGFLVAREGTANYCQTALSLSATLNLRYLDELAGSTSDDRRPLKRLIADALVFRAFRSLGYRVVTFDSGFDATEAVEGDLIVEPARHLGTFPSMVVDQTPLWLLLGASARFEPHQRHRERILKVFEDLPASTHPSNQPTFTFAHVVAPHPPFLFGADGRDRSEVEGEYTLNDVKTETPQGSAEYAARYRDQAIYITRRVEEVVARILTTSEIEPIIIIQGDHGPGSRFHADLDEPNDLFERMTNLNAIYLPKAFRQPIDPAITPVNTFRLVFDRCFGAKLRLLPDRNFYSPYPRPYDFTEVTGKVKRAGE